MLEKPEARAKLRRKLETWPDDRKSPVTINQGLELLELIERLEYQLKQLEGVAQDYNKQLDWFADEKACKQISNGCCCGHDRQYWREAARKAVEQQNDRK